jgi:hypothetical protein
MTEFKPDRQTEQGQISVNLSLDKQIIAVFDGGLVSSDGGLLLLQKADQRLGLSELAAVCVGDDRRLDLVKHTSQQLFQQRMYGIAAGYEDCNDVARVGKDAMHQQALGRMPNSGIFLASQPTLSRFENSFDSAALAALQRLLVHTFVRTRKKWPKVLRLFMDTTHDPVHGYQQLSFYNGYYETYCYTPLFIFSDCGFPLCALLRQGNASPAEGTLRMLRQIVRDLKLSWPQTRIELIADAGFAVPELYEYCEANGVTYYIGGNGHAGYQYHSEPLVRQCKALFEELGGRVHELKKYAIPVNPKARKIAWRQREKRIRFSSKPEGRMQEHFEDLDLVVRRYCEFNYDAREWSRKRRVIARCEYTAEGSDVRYVLTNATGGTAKRIYEDRYCPRAKCENWIKELKNYVKCDRTSCQEFEANQLRLLLHTFAYALLWEVRRKAQMRHVTVETIRLQLIKIGVLVKETSGKVWLHLASEHPWQKEFSTAWLNL